MYEINGFPMTLCVDHSVMLSSGGLQHMYVQEHVCTRLGQGTGLGLSCCVYMQSTEGMERISFCVWSSRSEQAHL